MQDVSLITIATRLAGHKRLIGRVTGVAVLIGLITSLMLPTRYMATAKLLTPQQTPSSASALMTQLASTGMSSMAGAAGGRVLLDPNEMYMGLLRSRPVADAIVQQFGLEKLYHARSATASREKLAANTEIVSEKSGLLAISVTDEDKKRAAAIANAYAEQLRLLTQKMAVTEASRRRLFYEQQVNRANDDLARATYSFQQVQKKEGLVQLDTQAKVLIDSLANLRAKVSATQVELQALRSYSTERNPDVELAENQLSALQAETARIEESNHPSKPLSLGLQDVAANGMDYLRTEHELQYRQAIFDLMLKQLDIAKLDEAKEAAVIQVVEPAIPPDLKSSPHRALVTFWFTALGFLAGCLCAGVYDFAQNTPSFARSLADFRTALLSN
jgi:uncharacterized protein involved in exopolysaccharide biosynthesis